MYLTTPEHKNIYIKTRICELGETNMYTHRVGIQTFSIRLTSNRNDSSKLFSMLYRFFHIDLTSFLNDCPFILIFIIGYIVFIVKKKYTKLKDIIVSFINNIVTFVQLKAFAKFTLKPHTTL